MGKREYNDAKKIFDETIKPKWKWKKIYCCC
jgi:hypothetical protein